MAVKSKVEISQDFVAFSEYMNFTAVHRRARGMASGLCLPPGDNQGKGKITQNIWTLLQRHLVSKNSR